MKSQRLPRYEGPATLTGGVRGHCTAELYETAEWDEFVTDLGFVEVGGQPIQRGWEGTLRFRRGSAPAGQLTVMADKVVVTLELLDGRAGQILAMGWNQGLDFLELDVTGVGPAPWAV